MFCKHGVVVVLRNLCCGYMLLCCHVLEHGCCCAKASFNLAYMHQFGIGVHSDPALARRHYKHCAEVDPASVQTPVSLMLALLSVQLYFAELPHSEEFVNAWLGDLRVHILVAHLVAAGVLLLLRRSFAGRVPLAVLSRQPETAADVTTAAVALGSQEEETGEGLRRRTTTGTRGPDAQSEGQAQ
ncbi:unnamed protein product [Polarella glacialis]|uniref:Uncharacterized protein n=1 Tax=Polarella glacialis TaxID=89957 RepID=A0A813JH89_POLGL|nr:unnamed protein product [Polarella glacialis]